MRDDEDIPPTIILNKSSSDGFLDFQSGDLDEVIRALNKLTKNID